MVRLGTARSNHINRLVLQSPNAVSRSPPEGTIGISVQRVVGAGWEGTALQRQQYTGFIMETAVWYLACWLPRWQVRRRLVPLAALLPWLPGMYRRAQS